MVDAQVNESLARLALGDFDIVQFSNNSSAGSANVTNNVQIDFFDSATAENAIITNAATGTVTFNSSSTGW